jgi:HEAT repeat protein
MLALVAVALAPLSAQDAPDRLSAAERAGIRDACYVANVREQDLKFARRPFQDSWRMAVVDEALDDPLTAADRWMAVHASATSANAAMASALGVFGAGQTGTPTIPEVPAPTGLPPRTAAAVARLVGALRWADQEIRAATKDLTPAEQRTLIESLPVLAVEEPRVQFAFVRGSVVGRDEVMRLMAKVDQGRLRAAGGQLLAWSSQVVSELRSRPEPFVGKVRLNVGGLPVVVAGTGDDVHPESDARLTLDLGGRDTYLGRHGAGVGYSGLLVDLSGNDTYDVPDLSLGAAVLGVGVGLDFGGDDTYRTRSIALGAGLAGCGVFVDRAGDDDYRSVALAQGFGHHGIGLLFDAEGDDRYDLRLFGQGASRTQGLGWLVDADGDDTYRAGGLSLNEPLFTGVTYSFAQGFSSGYREDTGGVSGGVGLLTDLLGADRYLGDTYLQAASYWFAVGSLYDASGDDAYSAHHYAQSSAMHCCAAFHFDLAGSDSYTTKVGASLAIGHDYGVAFLLDRAGDDLYIGQDSTPGVGVANGLGIFVDAAGKDRYDGPPGQGNAARGTGSLGVFADLDGIDKYRAGLEDGRAVAGSTWGASFDAGPFPAPARPNTPPVTDPPQVGSEPDPGPQVLASLYAKATQWGVGSAAEEVQESTARLIRIGLPAWDWMVANRLAGADRLQLRAFAAVARAICAPAAASLARAALSGTVAVKRNSLSVAVDAGLTDLGALVPAMLEDPELQLAAARAAGPLKAVGALAGLMRSCLSTDRLLARAATVSLAQLGDPSTLATGQAMLKSDDLLTRQAAMALVLRFPEQAVETGRSMTAESDEYRVRLGAQLLAAEGSPEAVRLLGGLLLDPRPGVRIEALRGLDGRCPKELETTFLALRNDPVAVVRAVALSVRPTKP